MILPYFGTAITKLSRIIITKNKNTIKLLYEIFIVSDIKAFQENKYKKGVDAEACRASSDPEGILSYVADDDETVCGYARQTFSVIFLECYSIILILSS